MRTHCLPITGFLAALAIAAEGFIIPKEVRAHCADAGKRCSISHNLRCCDTTLSCIKKYPSADDEDVVHVKRLHEEEAYCLKRAAAFKTTPFNTMARIVSISARPVVSTTYVARTTTPAERNGTIAAISTKPASTRSVAARTATSLKTTGSKMATAKRPSTKPASTRSITARTATSLKTTGSKMPAANSPSASQNAAGHRFIQQILDVHNKYRAEVGSPALTWSATLASDALQWANHLASSPTLSLVHSGASGQGENLWGGASNHFSYTQMAQAWADEKAYFTGPAFNRLYGAGGKQIGHYTQMVWKKTTQIGCAVGTGHGVDYLVCRYTPPGNVVGQNVY